MSHQTNRSPLHLTINSRLDSALNHGNSAWEAAAKIEGPEKTAAWIVKRCGEVDHDDRVAITEAVTTLLEAEDPNDAATARAELAEALFERDDPLADSLWEGVLGHAREVGDVDLLFEATVHLAEIAEAHGEPLVAADYFIEFLNWRREPDHASDPEQVLSAFDEIVRLAELDGAQEPAARWAFRQAAYHRLAEAEDERAFSGDWEKSPDAYSSWE